MYFFPLEATYFIASDLSVLGKKVVKLHDKHEQCFLITLHFTVNKCNKICGDFYSNGRPVTTIDKT